MPSWPRRIRQHLIQDSRWPERIQNMEKCQRLRTGTGDGMKIVGQLTTFGRKSISGNEGIPKS